MAVKLTIKQLGAVGLAKDPLPYDLPPNGWSDAGNVRCEDGRVSSFPGHEEYTTPTVTPYWLQGFSSGTAYYWLYAGLDKVYVYDGTNHTNLTRQTASVDVDYTGTTTDRWNGGVLNGVPVLNNGIDDPQMWNPVSTGQRLQALTAWPASTKAKVIRPYKNYLVALHVSKSGTDYPHLVKWSDAADPGAVPASWDETDTAVDAGENPLSETSGYIVDGLVLGDEFIIYKEDTAHGMQFVGGQFVFNFRRIRIPGMLAQGCAAEFLGRHFVVSNGDVYVHDGSTHESVIDQKNRDFLFGAIDPDAYESTFVVRYAEKSEIWICYPSAGASLPDAALVWNYRTGAWYPRDLPTDTAHIAPGIITQASETWATTSGTWDTATGTWGSRSFSPVNDSLVAASDTLYQMDSGVTFGGANPTCFVERTGIDIGSTDDTHLITRLYPQIEGGAVSIKVGTQMHPNDGVTWGSASTFTPGTDYKVDVLANGRFHALRIESTDGARWSLSSIGVDYEATGR